uniref:Uncharacterized protein n=1 Tax=Cacopsylla melanoneura TaxID=428564 RepID=A0A8D8XH88_9HEMI
MKNNNKRTKNKKKGMNVSKELKQNNNNKITNNNFPINKTWKRDRKKTSNFSANGFSTSENIGREKRRRNLNSLKTAAKVFKFTSNTFLEKKSTMPTPKKILT